LTFLKRPELVALVRALAEQPDIRSALTHAEIPESQHAAYLQALRSLAATDMICPRNQEPR
jgi:putative mycofactocin binding protein MftB